MIITVNEDWRLASDSLQWTIQHRSGSGETERWNGVAYFRDIDRALLELVRRQVSVLAGTYGAEALKPLCDALQGMGDDIRAALSTFRTEAAAYHGRAGS